MKRWVKTTPCRPAAALLALVLMGCGDRAPSPDALAASRSACQHEALWDDAQQELAALQLDTTTMGRDPAAVFRLHAAQVARQFAAASVRHAEVQFRHAAYLDSAANTSSAEARQRFEREAARFAVRTPNPGSVEENVARDYARDLARLRADSSHACYRIFR